MGLTYIQGFARLGIETTSPRLEMSTTKPRLEITQKHAAIKMHTEHPKVQIDQSEAFSSAGLKSYKELTREQAERAYQYVLEYIGKTAEDGSMLAAIENKANMLAEIAERDSFPQKEFGLTFIPGARPKISLINGYLSVDPGDSPGALNSVNIDFIQGNVQYNFLRGDVKVYLQQKNFLNFVYEPDKVDLYL